MQLALLKEWDGMQTLLLLTAAAAIVTSTGWMHLVAPSLTWQSMWLDRTCIGACSAPTLPRLLRQYRTLWQAAPCAWKSRLASFKMQ